MDSPKGGISVLQGKRVSRIDAKAQVAHLEDGTTIGYDKCLIATGGKPKNLPQLDNVPAEIKDKVTLFRKIEDFRNLEAVAREAKSITIFGGGFLGSELACALGHRGKKSNMEVVQAYQEPGNMGKVLPDYLSDWTTEKVRAEGVRVLPNSGLKGVSATESGQLELSLQTGEKVKTDHLVVAVGVEPDLQLAHSSNLEIDPVHGGFKVLLYAYNSQNARFENLRSTPSWKPGRTCLLPETPPPSTTLLLAGGGLSTMITLW